MGRDCDLCHYPSTSEVDESGHRYDKCTNPSCGAYYDDTGVSFMQPEGWKDWMKHGYERKGVLERVGDVYWAVLTVVVHALMWLVFGLFVAQIVVSLYY